MAYISCICVIIAKRKTNSSRHTESPWLYNRHRPSLASRQISAEYLHCTLKPVCHKLIFFSCACCDVFISVYTLFERLTFHDISLSYHKTHHWYKKCWIRCLSALTSLLMEPGGRIVEVPLQEIIIIKITASVWEGDVQRDRVGLRKKIRMNPARPSKLL